MKRTDTDAISLGAQRLSAPLFAGCSGRQKAPGALRDRSTTRSMSFGSSTFSFQSTRANNRACGITIDRAFHEPMWKTMQRMRNFYGHWGFFRLGLRFMRARLRGRSIELLAVSAGVPVVPTNSLNSPEYVERVRVIAPDVIVSVAAPRFLDAELLSVPRLGCVNVHSGRLPTYRGMMPTFWQMQRGEPAATITVHRMAERLMPATCWRRRLSRSGPATC